jgi:hypothetical protein
MKNKKNYESVTVSDGSHSQPETASDVVTKWRAMKAIIGQRLLKVLEACQLSTPVVFRGRLSSLYSSVLYLITAANFINVNYVFYTLVSS